MIFFRWYHENKKGVKEKAAAKRLKTVGEKDENRKRKG
ncbi:MAG: hypothetical protein CSYNP_00195 [Syntrophus sp. SKADARSKE-3]|nr:hypothetical protein [Syntrophus sp. SKADARSKE-3]